jgi:hypothetical protein
LSTIEDVLSNDAGYEILWGKPRSTVYAKKEKNRLDSSGLRRGYEAPPTINKWGNKHKVMVDGLRYGPINSRFEVRTAYIMT